MPATASVVAHSFADLLDLVLPRTCAGCGSAGRTLCRTCEQALAGRPFDARPSPCPAGLPRVAASAAYGGPVRAVLLAHKEHGRLSLAGPLGRSLAGAVGAATCEAGLVRQTVLVPVPSDPAAVRSRGHDHARRVAAVAARHLGVRARPLLVAARSRADQAGLDAAGRAVNLGGSLAARRALPLGLPVVVVDDLVTTGASLAEACRALRAAGADVRACAVVAATARTGTAATARTGTAATARTGTAATARTGTAATARTGTAATARTGTAATARTGTAATARTGTAATARTATHQGDPLSRGAPGV